MVIPFITIEIVQEIAQPTVTPGNIQILPTTAVVVEETNYVAIALWGLYGLVTVVLGFRFMRNVVQISKKMKSNTPIAYYNAQLVLVPEKTLPHTFLNTIFINETEYNNRQVEAELYTHELTHVTQKHTLDILAIEVLKTIFWFNPIFIFYKKAIQLNHEFLADEKVVHSYNNVPFYQSLLLSKANANPTFYLASNLNYLITKKRLLMMTKTTSQKISLVKKMTIIPVLSILLIAFCIKTVAREKNNTIVQQQPILNEKIAIAKSALQQIEKAEKPSDTVKRKKLEVVKIRNEEYTKIGSLYFNDKGSVDINGNPAANGYININNDVHFYVTKGTEREYYNRYGFRVDSKGVKLNNDTITVLEKDYQVEASKLTSSDQVGDIYTTTGITEKPDFPGGMMEFYKFVGQNFKTPEQANLKGKVYITFIIEKDGSISDVKNIRDIGFGTGDEAVRVIKLSPKWLPGKMNGVPVRVMYSLPITIQSAKS
ncbi:regulatory sensor-transducer, BlaR1/MecR1 family protein [Flavobacterium sp. SOK18b]|nr:regulatory sensor-transducer, BlaR1/MecR1 family protein [Flavobacterium sp. SOK18b]